MRPVDALVVFRIDKSFRDRYKILQGRNKIRSTTMCAALRATYYLMLHEAAEDKSNLLYSLTEACKTLNFDPYRSLKAASTEHKVFNENTNHNISGVEQAGDTDERHNTDTEYRATEV